MRIAVLASGSGSNFEALVKATQNGVIAGEIVCLVSDKPQAFVLQRAKNLRIETVCAQVQDFSSKVEYEDWVVSQLQARGVELVLLAGYMRIIGPKFLDAFENRIINIHPSLLPAYPGMGAIGAAYRDGVEKTGVSVHFVDEGVDTGPIIAQCEVPVYPEQTLQELEERIHVAEHELYVKVVADLVTAGHKSWDKGK